MIYKSDAIDQLAMALAKAQSQFKPIIKNSLNPFFKSKYADLGAIFDATFPALHANGLALSQHPSSKGSEVTVSSILMHVSGQWMASDFAITANDPKPQTIGSCTTYAKRYGVQGILGVHAEDDDDGNLAQSGSQTKGQQQYEKRPPVAAKNPSSDASGPSEEAKADGQGQAALNTGSPTFEFSASNPENIRWLEWHLRERKLFNPELRNYLIKNLDGKTVKKAAIDTYIDKAIEKLAAATLEQEAKK